MPQESKSKSGIENRSIHTAEVMPEESKSKSGIENHSIHTTFFRYRVKKLCINNNIS
jgi:hypothetical protein